ncbi:PAS domain-containing sensor histidine kinase [Rufibacter latericius]|uniref:histidine kinase n=1 Tax=Rufibacter latericius TaxID=2487040 RepID=A0A3M9MUS1_9BACT|nr:PAS domain S-box protein [Rufibacter latericius]RNI29249.1 PAS domain S-box protein [Rufibacter latericius]
MKVNSSDELPVTYQLEDYRILFDHNPLPMWVYDTESLRFLMVNAAALNLYGFSRDEFLQMTIKDIRPADHLSKVLEVVNSSRETLHYAGEWIHVKKDGALLHVEVVSHELSRQSSSGPERLVVIHDITARKLAEKQLAEAEQYAHSILNNMVEVVFSFNEKMEMTYISPQCLHILGYAPSQFYADKYLWFNLVHPADRSLFEESLPKIRTSREQYQLEYRIQAASGEEKWLITRCTAQLNEEGRMVRIDGSANDITRRKQIQEKLRFADFSIERASDAFLWTRADAQIMRVNRATCSLLGYLEEELLTLRLFAIVPELDEKSWPHRWAEFENLKSMSFETVFKARDGQLHPVEVHFNYFKFEQETYSFATIRQIAERKQAEAEKARLTEEMSRQNEHLRQFAYIVSHNLRAPVANIVGLINLYNRQNLDDPMNAVLMTKLERTTQRLDTTIRDLNDILTIRSKSEQSLEKVDLQQILSEVRESVAGQLVKYSPGISVDFTQGKTVLGVKGYVHSIFLNLITNAIKYQASDRPLEIHINTVISDGYLCLQIQDNGLGIDLVKQGTKVFGLYRRFHPQIEGKGLGLHMIKTQAETMGGWVDLESEVGKGSTFKVYFQVAPKNDEIPESFLN